MQISEYDKFVQNTDQYAHLGLSERKEIAIYGLASEIGSVASAIKKKLLNEDGATTWNVPSSEIIEELGDVMWYCFALARVSNPSKPVNIFIHDIGNLKAELAAGDSRSEQIRRVIGSDNRQAFLDAADSFKRSTRDMTFKDYQSIAYLTARTEERVLVEVCIAVLYQLSAELFRVVLPDIERQLNKSLNDRPFNDVLGEIAWHVAALASIYGLDLGDVARSNIEKVSYRQNRNNPVIVHDLSFPLSQRFPRRIEICFVTVGKGKAQMYFEGRRLGDQLTDNSYNGDGYRFHDVMHLANIAHLGWSPVVRSLMGRKRKADSSVDEIEDGARAKIVEEAVIKAIHSEGERLASSRNHLIDEPVRLFPNRDEISFKFLKFIQSLVVGLEVSKNRFWEWENAIMEGYDAYHRLRLEGQGTIELNLDERSLKYHPHVYIPLAGRVVGFGTSIASKPKTETCDEEPAEVRLGAKRRAILASLGFASPTADQLSLVSVIDRDDNEISVRLDGSARDAMWSRRVIAFRSTTLELDDCWIYNVLALADE
jgi:NTP pyrophosphatase (non-canonical NTP hydrolase)